MPLLTGPKLTKVVQIAGVEGIKGDKGDPGDPLSIPPQGYCKITNLYVNPLNGKIVVEYDDIPV